ncbi:MAG: ATP-binding protein, partial [Halobacteriaceae archaeon]
MNQVPETITITDDGFTLPVIELLTGRGFVTGKSGAGKSNTASVVAEELLSLGIPLLIIDTDGEYYGLKEKFELLHVGATEECDREIQVEDAEEIAEVSLREGLPVILDLSGFMDEDTVSDLVCRITDELFRLEQEERKPFLIMIEEIHEFLPQRGTRGAVSETLIRIAKRGRKHGLGITGMSQRPASVDKDFITQCDWIAWHRLTWSNDVAVVRDILGTEYADEVKELETGEAFLMTDWDESINRLKIRQKHTHDAGAA